MQKDALSSGAGPPWVVSGLSCLAGAVRVLGGGSAKHGTSGSDGWVSGWNASKSQRPMSVAGNNQIAQQHPAGIHSQEQGERAWTQAWTRSTDALGSSGEVYVPFL